MHDCLHGQYLGTGKLANGSTLIYLAERGAFGPWVGIGRYKDILALKLRTAHAAFCHWKKTNRLECTQPRFTPARLSRTPKLSFPCLAATGIASKVLTFWIAHVSVEFASKREATSLDKMVAVGICAEFTDHGHITYTHERRCGA